MPKHSDCSYTMCKARGHLAMAEKRTFSRYDDNLPHILVKILTSFDTQVSSGCVIGLGIHIYVCVVCTYVCNQ